MIYKYVNFILRKISENLIREISNLSRLAILKRAIAAHIIHIYMRESIRSICKYLSVFVTLAGRLDLDDQIEPNLINTRHARYERGGSGSIGFSSFYVEWRRSTI